jgi:hypothetical protein
MRVRVLVGSHGLKPSDCVCNSGLKVHSKVHMRPTRSSTTNGPSSGGSTAARTDLMKDHPVLSTIDTLCSKKIEHVPGRKNWLLSFSPDGECITVAAGDEAVYTMHLREDDEVTRNTTQEVVEAMFHGFDRPFFLVALVGFLYVTWLISL